MTSTTPITIDVPTCPCVIGARKISKVFPIPSRFKAEACGTGTSAYQVYGCVDIHCGYCGTILKTRENINTAMLVEIRESQEKSK